MSKAAESLFGEAAPFQPRTIDFPPLVTRVLLPEASSDQSVPTYSPSSDLQVKELIFCHMSLLILTGIEISLKIHSFPKT